MHYNVHARIVVFNSDYDRITFNVYCALNPNSSRCLITFIVCTLASGRSWTPN